MSMRSDARPERGNRPVRKPVEKRPTLVHPLVKDSAELLFAIANTGCSFLDDWS